LYRAPVQAERSASLAGVLGVPKKVRAVSFKRASRALHVLKRQGPAGTHLNTLKEIFMSTKTPDFTDTLNELDAGLFSAKVSAAVAEAALATVEHGDKGKSARITIELTMKRIGDSSQIDLTHKLSYSRPTKRGKASEEDTTSTPLFVGRHGALGIAPEHQMQLFQENA